MSPVYNQRMNLSCNIDSRGRRIRLAIGVVLTLAGASVLLLLAPASGTWCWIVGACILISGLFGLFEARYSWCALRAMGFKTQW